MRCVNSAELRCFGVAYKFIPFLSSSEQIENRENKMNRENRMKREAHKFISRQMYSGGSGVNVLRVSRA